MKKAITILLGLIWWVSIILICGVSECGTSDGNSILVIGVGVALFYGAIKWLEAITPDDEKNEC